MSDIVQPLPGCIDANPDIAGIGVRSAIYTQNFMVLFLALLAFNDNKITKTELQVAEAQATSILLTACALLISAFVQAKTLGMSTYHAIIVLNLAWMNNTNTFTCMVLFICRSKYRFSRQNLKDFPVIPLILGSLHLSFLAGFGLWFWATVDTFGAAAQCAPRLSISHLILGRSIAVTSRALRIISLTIYAAIAFPGLNVVVLGGMMMACAFFLALMPGLVIKCTLSIMSRILPQPLEAPSLWRSMVGHFSLYLLLSVNIVMVADTEAMVTLTKPFVKPGESEWTFGQTLALLLLMLPLLEFIRSWVKQPREERLQSFRSFRAFLARVKDRHRLKYRP